MKRIKADLIIDQKVEKNKYADLIGKECLYLNKYYILETIDLKSNTIVLKEKQTNNFINIIKDDEKGISQLLSTLFNDNMDDVITKNKLPSEIDRLKAAKNFKSFRDNLIKQYSGKELVNNIPGLDPNDIICIDEDTGYLYNSNSNKQMTKEESLEIWKYLYKNQDLVGKIVKYNPVKKFIDIKIKIKKTTVNDIVEDLIYSIVDITEEEENGEIKYRLHSKNIMNPFANIEKSTTLLSYDDLESFIKASRVD